MNSDGQIVIAEFRKIREQQRKRWEQANALLPNVVPKALGLIHARAAWDINYAKRLVFDHFELTGSATRDGDPKEILDAVKSCLTILQDDLDDPFNPSDKDWKRLEEIASL